MKNLFPIIRCIKKWLSHVAIAFIGISISALVIAPLVPVEFANRRIERVFYEAIFIGLPIAIILTLAKHRWKKLSFIEGFFRVIATLAIAFFSFSVIIEHYMWTAGFGTWKDWETVYEHREHPDIKIVEQIEDIGAFGYGSKRIVKLTPLLGLFQVVTPIDTAQVDENKWLLVNRPADLKFP